SFGEEIQRLINGDGLALITHVRNVNCHTFNPGMPLTPAGYRNIFGHWPTRILSESEVFDTVVSGKTISLAGRSDDELADAPLLIIATTRDERLLGEYQLPSRQPAGRVSLNPLYSADAK